jgi:general secretion pathway protein M
MATLALQLQPRQSRWLAVALLALAVVLAAAVLLAPFLLLHWHYDAAIDALESRLDVYRRVAAQTPELKKALDALRARDGRRFFLQNTAPNLAGAELQDLVRAAIENNGGRITTIQIAQPREEGRFRQIGVSVQLFATTPNLQKILYTLETQAPYALVDNITVRPLNAFRGFKPPPGAEPELSVMLDVSGFTLLENEKSEAEKKPGDRKEAEKKGGDKK